VKINNIFSTLKNLQLSKDKLLLILLGGVLLVIISLPVKGKNEADNTADSRDTGEAIEYEYADISDYTTELEARLSARFLNIAPTIPRRKSFKKIVFCS
jgi:hypothetical protein